MIVSYCLLTREAPLPERRGLGDCVSGMVSGVSVSAYPCCLRTPARIACTNNLALSVSSCSLAVLGSKLCRIEESRTAAVANDFDLAASREGDVLDWRSRSTMKKPAAPRSLSSSRRVVVRQGKTFPSGARTLLLMRVFGIDPTAETIASIWASVYQSCWVKRLASWIVRFSLDMAIRRACKHLLLAVDARLYRMVASRAR